MRTGYGYKNTHGSFFSVTAPHYVFTSLHLRAYCLPGRLRRWYVCWRHRWFHYSLRGGGQCAAVTLPHATTSEVIQCKVLYSGESNSSGTHVSQTNYTLSNLCSAIVIWVSSLSRQYAVVLRRLCIGHPIHIFLIKKINRSVPTVTVYILTLTVTKCAPQVLSLTLDL